MSGALQVTFMNQRSFGSPTPPAPTVIGQAYEGGFWAGDIGVSGVATHHLVVGPVSTAQTTIQMKNANTITTGTKSVIDGPQNTADMIAAGDATVFPCAHFCNNLVIGGFSDWYIPANNEIEVCYFNLKPSTTANVTSTGINPNAVPARASNYTSGNPAQTSAAAFQTGGAEAFSTTSPITYWSSTESSSFAGFNYGKYFTNGGRYTFFKTANNRVRAIRRVPV